MKRNNIFIFQWVAWLCLTLAACSELGEELAIVGKATESNSDTRADLIEYTINVETAGTLSSLVEAGNYSDAQKLIIKGNIGYKDVNYVDVNMPTVEVLDLVGASYESESISGAFLSDSTKIKEISLPGNITSIKWYAFSGCSSLTSITIPEGVTTIGWNAFEYCSSLTSITLPESLTRIEGYVFYGCSSLTSINIPEGVTSIGGSAFEYCSSLTSITLPERLTSIQFNTFSGCSSLTSITLPESLTSIGNYAFEGCSSLTSITLPERLTSIGNDAFLRCSSLTCIILPESLTSIGSGFLWGCSSLTSITLPESLTSIGDDAFRGCSSLLEVNWYCALPITGLFNRNPLLIFTKDGTIPEGATEYKNIVVNGKADELDITDWNEDLSGYSISAKKVIYTKTFPSVYDISDRWYTIALPFKPTQITHETKGTIVPFDSGIEGAKNFWLRELSSNGYQDVAEMEASHPYIIAMPTSNNYSWDFRLGGTVTFSAENVTLNWEPAVSEGPTYSMYPTYETVKKSMDVYAMNSEYWVDGYDYGHVWVRGAMDVHPFEAYVKLNDGTATMRSVLPMSDGKRTAVRGASSSGNASSRGAYGHQKPQRDDM